jgi:phosphoribosylformylglycinamidine cyclo-ligase
MDDNLDYRRAGVDIDAGEAAVERIKKLAHSTFRPEVLQELGGFGGLFAPNLAGMKEPVLVAGCDGVGTKLKLAFALNKHDTIGIDCVAMCVNDILVQGAEPLFFLDYLAVGRLEPGQVEKVVAGVAEGCRQAGCALLGGEMAEMPGFYPEGEYDIAGFAVGMADRANIIDGSTIKTGDRLVGLASNGLHSNGFSLARKVLLEKAGVDLDEVRPGMGDTLGRELLKPTFIYVKPVMEALKQFKIKGMAHITGGGLPGNLPRILPGGAEALIDTTTWDIPQIFKMIAADGPVEREEMFRVFNMGIGYVLVAEEKEEKEIIDYFNNRGISAYVIGAVREGGAGVKLLF